MRSFDWVLVGAVGALVYRVRQLILKVHRLGVHRA